ncbi:MAG: RimK family alpha-L-glutamate ligase [Acidimicrobiia bacterium]
MHLIFATCAHQPLPTEDDQVLADALKARGVTVTPIPWTELDPYAVVDSPPILLRSTWDYHRVPTMFIAWLQALQNSGRTAWNAPEVTRRNVDKQDLGDLEGAGLAIPRTRWIDNVDNTAIASLMSAEGWSRAVLKPRIAATAYGTFLVDRDTELSDADLTPARNSGALLQEFIPEVVEHGETSLIYFDGRFSHAILKRAASGEFRVQKDFGGHVERVTPSAELLAFGSRVIEHSPGCLYARVDVVAASRGPLLMELELIEPELYFLNAPEAATQMAQLIVERIHP